MLNKTDGSMSPGRPEPHGDEGSSLYIFIPLAVVFIIMTIAAVVRVIFDSRVVI